MLKALDEFNNFEILLAAAPTIETELYLTFLDKYQNVKIINNDTYNLLNQADLAIVTSGTATLETALFKVPQVVCYKSSWISYQIAKQLIKVKYISLVNLILDKECVKELIQNDLTPKNIAKEISKILDPIVKKNTLNDYEILEKKCGGIGASKITANKMLKTIKQLR